MQKEAHWQGVIEPDSQWAFAKEGSYKMALRKMKNEHHVYLGMATELAKSIKENFSEDAINQQFAELVYGEEESDDIIIL